MPVDLNQLARFMMVRVRYVNFIDHPSSGLTALFQQTENGPVCWIKDDESETVRRFALAHSIGHYVLDHGTECYDEKSAYSTSQNNHKEMQANRFAAALLMPASVFIFAARKLEFDIAQLAETFKVSQAAVRFRLEMLGYSL